MQGLTDIPESNASREQVERNAVPGLRNMRRQSSFVSLRRMAGERSPGTFGSLPWNPNPQVVVQPSLRVPGTPIFSSKCSGVVPSDLSLLFTRRPTFCWGSQIMSL
jgi:hypothetical protein